MKCPACRGRLEAKSTRDTDQPGRTLRYRKCRSCGKSYPTIETVLAFRAIPKQAQVTVL